MRRNTSDLFELFLGAALIVSLATPLFGLTGPNSLAEQASKAHVGALAANDVHGGQPLGVSGPRTMTGAAFRHDYLIRSP